MFKLIQSALVVAALAVSGSAMAASSNAPPLLKKDFAWEGMFGQYDQASLRRGFQIFHDVCSNCHGLRQVAYRNLSAVGLTEDEIKAVAAEREKPAEPNDEGEVLMRPGVAADKYIGPFPNDKAAASANGGALPPDLSLMAKARVGGPHYVYSLLLGYKDEAPAGVEIPDGKSYNDYFPGNAISMPPQLFEGLVEYADGTAATPEQMATDITAFLNWAAEPELNERKSLGLKVLIFLGLLSALLYALKRQIWKNVH